MFYASMFRNCYDKQPQLKTFASWADLTTFLQEQSEIPSASTKTQKHNTPLISPALYRDGLERAKSNVALWGNWFAVDIDNKLGLDPDADMEKVAEKFIARGLAFIIYTTTSHTMTNHCFRVLFPTSRAIEADEFNASWHSVAKWLGCVDKATKDESRMFTLPRQWDGGDVVFFDQDGAALDIDALTREFPATFEQKRAVLIEAFKIEDNDLKPVPLHWIDVHGPLVNDKAREEAMMSTPGGRMFRFLCSVAGRALWKGYAITAQELADIGRQLASILGRDCSDIAHDANNALRKAHAGYASAKATRYIKTFPTLNSEFVKRAS